MIGTAADQLDRRLPRCGNGFVALQYLRITQNRIEWGSQFVAETDNIAALGAVGGFSIVLGLLQRRVSSFVCGDFL